MLLLLNCFGAQAQDMTFDCPSITTPPDARPYYDTSPLTAAGEAWDEVYAWFDASCVVSCTPDATATSCESASCVTGAGATLTWEEQVYEGGGYSGEDSTVYTLTVVPPATGGLAWTSATIERTETDSYEASYMDASASDYTVSWSGELLSGWPTDGSFEAYSQDGEYIGTFEYRTWSYARWSSDGCDWWHQSWFDANEGETLEVGLNTDPDIAVEYPHTVGSYPCDTEKAFEWRGYTNGDLYGRVDETTWERDGDDDGDGFSTTDCDDTDPYVNTCAGDVSGDGVDSNCDGAEDADGDGVLDTAEGGDDCDDTDSTIYLGALEIPYDGIDQDCDGADLTDPDGDGAYGTRGGGDDCDDYDATVYVGATEVAYDGVDQDCDGADLTDVDGDGADALVAGADDCDDEDATVYVGATETPYDGQDQDCDGADLTDADGDGADALVAGGDDCDDGDATSFVGGADVPYDGVDQDCDGADLTDVDGDGYDALAAGGDDCDDDDDDVHPGATEVAYDGLDQDCDGGDLADLDEDGHDALAAGGDDCDDDDDTIYTGATETPYDGIDQDCDGGDVIDADGDGGYGEAVGGNDCDDGDDTIYTGATEVECDGLDQDCDGDDSCPGDPPPSAEEPGCGGSAAALLFPALGLLRVSRRRDRV